jgi:hypothetical protein
MTANFETWWEKTQDKIIAGTIAIILGIGAMIYTDMKQRVYILEDKVAFLYNDKVSKAEFKEEMTQLRLQNDANKSDIIARQDALKNDILQRMDMLNEYLKRK